MTKPPIEKLERNEYGLLKNIDYIYNEFGRIDYRAMLPKKYLVPNAKKTVETDISKLKDDELLILLGGIRFLAEIRGYTTVKTKIIPCGAEYVAATVDITFIGNYETNNREITFPGSSDAHPYNTGGFAKSFLASIAENRAFARAVRNFLRIEIVSEEEISEIPKAEPKDEIYLELQDELNKKKLTFDFIKTMLKEEGFAGEDKILTIDDIPKFKVTGLLKKIKKFKN